MGDFRNTVVRIGQKFFTCLDSGLAQIVDGGTAAMHGECVNHVVFVEVGELCKGIQGDVLHVIGFDISLYFDTFFADLDGRGYFKCKICPADEFDDQYFQKILADIFIIPVFFCHFIQHGCHVKQ